MNLCIASMGMRSPKLAPKPRSLALESRIEGKKIKFRKPVVVNVIGYPVSVVPLPALFIAADKPFD